MNKLFITLLASAMTLFASAQTQPMQMDLKQNMYKGKLGLSQVRNLSDTQVKEIGKRHGAIALPTKAETARMMKEALANRPSKARKSTASNIYERYSAANYTNADTLMFEGWESWIIDVKEGTTHGFNWRPNTWIHKSNFDAEKYISEAKYSCPTWMCYQTDGYYVPYATEGDAVMLCMAGEEVKGSDGVTIIAPAPEQDEWLASSVVNNIKSTNYLSFDLAYTPIYSHLFTGENNTIDIKRLAYDVEVLVTTSLKSTTINENNYTCIFKLSDVVDDMLKSLDLNDEKDLTTLRTLRWQHFRVSLADYAEKNIRVAFRYNGKMAGNVMLDAVRVSDMLPVAKYDKPEGSFYFGFSTQAHLSPTKTVLMPAYTETQWTNYSNEDAESYEWNYKINGTNSSSTDRNLIMPGITSGATIYWPSMQAIAGIRSDMFCGGTDMNGNGIIEPTEYGTAKVGGDGVLTYQDTQQGQIRIDFGLGNYDPTKKHWLGELATSGDYYAFGTGSSSFWAEMTDYAYNSVSGIANFFDKPAAPYVFSRVTLPLGAWSNWGADIVCTVYKAKELPGGGLEITDEVLGQTVTQNAEYIQVAQGYVLSFNFPNIMIIDQPICIAITGLDNDNLMKFAPITQALNHDSNMGYAFVILKNQGNGNKWWCEIAGALAAFEGPGNMQVSHAIGMNAIFPYLHSNDGDVFTAAEAGETKSFDIDSYWYPQKLDANDTMNGWTIECAETWLTVTPTLDKDAQKAGVDITVQALPAGVPGRTATVTIKALGCEQIITVNQGDITAIEGVTMNGFTSANGTYNISGQRINSKNAKGGLFIENRGGKFVKVIK